MRRLVGLTGEAASASIQTGLKLSEAVEGAVSLPTPTSAAELESARELLAKAKQMLSGKEEEVTPPAHVRASAREALAERERKLAAVGKALAAQAAGSLGEEAAQMAEAAAAEGKPYAALQLAEGIDPKTLASAVQGAAKRSGLAVLGLSADTEADKVSCAAAAPEGGVLAANTWLSGTLAAVGGRGGGKPAAAQGSGKGAGQVGAALEAAEAIAKEAFE